MEKNMVTTHLFERISTDFQRSDAILLPLRLFIGLGWLRAGVEKVTDPTWHSGSALTDYFHEQIAAGDVAFPFYEMLMTGLFTDHASVLSNLIIAGEFYAGLAILFGFFTRPALIGGLFMNLNFIMAGTVNPSAFYIMIQITLLASNVGHVLGIDGFLHSWQAHKEFEGPSTAGLRRQMRACLVGAAVMLLGIILAVPQVQSVDPATSIEDPALLLTLLFALSGSLLVVLYARVFKRIQAASPAVPAEDLSTRNQYPNQYQVTPSDFPYRTAPLSV